jgi:hypothetical protein
VEFGDSDSSLIGSISDFSRHTVSCN